MHIVYNITVTFYFFMREIRFRSSKVLGLLDVEPYVESNIVFQKSFRTNILHKKENIF